MYLTFMPSFFVVMVHAMVEFTSPTTITRSGFSLKHTFSNSNYPGSLLSVAARPNPKINIRLWHTQIFKKSLTHLFIVLLSCMHQKMFNLARI